MGYTDADGAMSVYRRSESGSDATTPVPQAEGSFNFAFTLEAGELSTLFVRSGSFSRGSTLQADRTASSAHMPSRLELGAETAQLRVTPSGGSAMLVNAMGQGVGASHELRLVEGE